jgi:hypothetical protein
LKVQEAGKIGVVHRSDGKTDIYFVVNRSENPQNATLNFRITGKKPEIWNADDLSIKEANVWLQMPNSTQVSLHLGGQEALFLVFRQNAEEKAHITAVESSSNASIWWNIGNNFYLSQAGSIDVAYSTGQKMKLSTDNPTKQGIGGTWKVDFKPKMGANFTSSFNELQDWSKNSDEKIRYFSGTALYTNTVDVTAESLSSGKRTVLDLGEMYDIARIRINGGSSIPVWYKPFKTDITQYLKAGANRIEIEVTNTWANALVGDERFPAGFEKRNRKEGYLIKDYPDWFLKNQEIPSGRKTFSVFNYYNNQSELHAAGLVGPVILTVYNPAQ